jgi:hypothetical protein
MKFIYLALAIGFGVTGALSAFAAPASPKPYIVDFKLEQDGRAVASPRVILNDGGSATISEETEAGGPDRGFIELLIQEERPDKSVLMKFALGTIDEKGGRSVYARPQVIAAEGRPSTLSVPARDFATRGEAQMTVTARRLQD